MAIVLLKAGTNPEPVVKRLKEMGFEATTRQNAFESFMKEVDAAMKIVKRIAYAFGGVLLLLACGLLWSTTSRIVSDSRVDIGLFRALGATKSDVRRLFLTETVFLGELGTLTGIFLGWTVAYWISRLVIHLASGEISDPEEMLMVPRTIFAVDWVTCGLLLVGAVGVSLLAGLWPASRAANVDPVKALKRE
jgi:ABC-type lipoprotein release transport system permease subunit